MNVAFIHDHPFIKKDNLVYTTGGLPSSVWDNYLLDNISSLRVIGRESSKTNSTTISSHESVAFYFSKYYNTPLDFWLNKSKIVIELEQQLLDIDKVIIRLPSFLGLLACEICEKNKIDYLVEVVGNAYDSLKNYNFSGKVIAKYVHILNKKAISKAVCATYVTERYLQDVYPNKKKTLGVSDVEIGEYHNTSTWRDYNQVRIKCGTVGNLEVRYKGYEVFFKVLKVLKSKGILIDYFIAGAGSNKYLESLSLKYGINDLVHFAGKLDRKQILSFYDDLDYYIHPSFQEGLPRVVVEAMSRGKVVLASNVGGIPELISKKYLHVPGDYEKLLHDISLLLNNSELYYRVSCDNFNRSKDYDVCLLKSKKRQFIKEFYESNRA